MRIGSFFLVAVSVIAPAAWPFRMRLGHLLFAGLIAAMMYAAPAKAQEDKWEFSLSPYVWVAGISGTVVGSGGTSADIDLKFSDLFNHVSGLGAMVGGEARYGRFGLVGDLVWLQVSTDFSTPKDTVFNGGSAKLSVLQTGLVGLYRFLPWGAIKIDGGAGMRLWSLDFRGKLHSGIVEGGSTDLNKTWVDPIFAARVLIQISKDWSATVYGDVGGFDVGSQLTWQALGTVNYSIASWMDLRVGYRQMNVKRDIADITLKGPIVIAAFKF